MLAIVFVLGLGLVLVGMGYSFVLWLDRRQALGLAGRVTCSLLVGALFLHYSVQAVGHVQLDRMSMGGLAVLLVLAAIPGWKRLPWRDLWRSIQTLPRLPLFLVLAVCLLSFLQGLAPPNDYDSLMYHLATPKADIERGYIAPDWTRGISNVFFPHLTTSLVRISLVLAGEGAAQTSVALLGLAATAAAGLLAAGLGAGNATALWASLLFAAARVVIWEMGSVEVDLPLAAASGTFLAAYLAYRKQPDPRLMVLLGVLLGICFNIKYQGGLFALACAPILLTDWLRRRVTFLALAITGLVALAVFLPHMIENYAATGNPIFPLYHSKFYPGGAAFYDTYHLTYGVGRGFFDLLAEPWLMSAAPMQYFDGMVLGSPYLLALLPGVFLGWRRLKFAGALMSVVVAYYVLWFYVQSHQVRFLTPVLPPLAAFAAIGATGLWQTSKSSLWLRLPTLALLAGLFINQSLFFGIYAALRLPSALGFMSAAAYHARTPTLQGAFYPTCRYISEHLPEGDRYLSFLVPHSYYCPQKAAIMRVFDDERKNWLWADWPHKISFPEFVRRLKDERVRFVAVPLASENRRNVTGESNLVSPDYESTRFGPFIAPALEGLAPLAAEPFSAVYDGGQVLNRLDAMLASGTYPDMPR